MIASLSRTGVGDRSADHRLCVGARRGGDDRKLSGYRRGVAGAVDAVGPLPVAHRHPVRGVDEPLPPALLERLSGLPGVAAISSVRRQSVESSVGRIELLALEPSHPDRSPYRMKSGDHAWQRFLTEDVVAGVGTVCEPPPAGYRRYPAPGHAEWSDGGDGLRASFSIIDPIRASQ